jgi:hypothetical protein
LVLHWPSIFIKNYIWCKETYLNKISTLPILTCCIPSCSIKLKIKMIAIWICCNLFIHVIYCINHEILLSTLCHIIITYRTLIYSWIRSRRALKNKNIIIWIRCKRHKFYTLSDKIKKYLSIDDVYNQFLKYIQECLYRLMLEYN